MFIRPQLTYPTDSTDESEAGIIVFTVSTSFWTLFYIAQAVDRGGKCYDCLGERFVGILQWLLLQVLYDIGYYMVGHDIPTITSTTTRPPANSSFSCQVVVQRRRLINPLVKMPMTYRSVKCRRRPKTVSRSRRDFPQQWKKHEKTPCLLQHLPAGKVLFHYFIISMHTYRDVSVSFLGEVRPNLVHHRSPLIHLLRQSPAKNTQVKRLDNQRCVCVQIYLHPYLIHNSMQNIHEYTIYAPVFGYDTHIIFVC